MAEKTNYLLFMINAFQSLEDEIVSETVLQLVSLRLWHSLSSGRFQVLDDTSLGIFWKIFLSFLSIDW